MTIPKVTFILPIYNAEKHLPCCLDSIVNQTVQNLEVICVNDCSPDKSSSILSEYARRDQRITIINFEKNKGTGAARNAGLEAANGEFIRMVDPDDFIPADSTEQLLKTAQQFNSDFVRGGLWHCNSTGNKINNNLYSPKQLVGRAQMDYRMAFYFGLHTTFLYRATLLFASGARYDETITNGEDASFMIDLAPYMKKVSLIPKTVYFYRKHTGSSMHKKRDKKFHLNIFGLYRRAYKHLSKAGLKEVADSYLHASCCRYFPNNLLYRLPNDLAIDQATTVLKDLRDLFSEFNARKLCFTDKYPWQKKRKIPPNMGYIILLLDSELFAEAYTTLQHYRTQKKKQRALTNQINLYKNAIDVIHSSTSWRITAPLRFLRNTMSK